MKNKLLAVDLNIMLAVRFVSHIFDTLIFTFIIVYALDNSIYDLYFIVLEERTELYLFVVRTKRVHGKIFLGITNYFYWDLFNCILKLLLDENIAWDALLIGLLYTGLIKYSISILPTSNSG